MKDAKTKPFETETEFFGRIPGLFLDNNQPQPFRPNSLLLQWHLRNQLILAKIAIKIKNYKKFTEHYNYV